MALPIVHYGLQPMEEECGKPLFQISELLMQTLRPTIQILAQEQLFNFQTYQLEILFPDHGYSPVVRRLHPVLSTQLLPILLQALTMLH